jgi:hypothetical protein
VQVNRGSFNLLVLHDVTFAGGWSVRRCCRKIQLAAVELACTGSLKLHLGRDPAEGACDQIHANPGPRFEGVDSAAISGVDGPSAPFLTLSLRDSSALVRRIQLALGGPPAPAEIFRASHQERSAEISIVNGSSVRLLEVSAIKNVSPLSANGLRVARDFTSMSLMELLFTMTMTSMRLLEVRAIEKSDPVGRLMGCGWHAISPP